MTGEVENDATAFVDQHTESGPSASRNSGAVLPTIGCPPPRSLVGWRARQH
jgi:hypothetical protein